MPIDSRHLRKTARSFPRTVPATAPAPFQQVKPFKLAGRTITPTPVFDTYWRFAAERQRVYLDRLAGKPGPWTEDPILAEHRFTNCYRATDRVSQYLIRNVSYQGHQSPDEIVFRTLLFKFFNKIETWELLQAELTDLSWATFDVDAYDHILSEAMNAGTRLYSAAYVMPTPALGATRKHTNHLRLLASMVGSSLPERLAQAASLGAVYEELLAFPSLGPFLAFQYAIDLNYSTLLEFRRDGLRRRGARSQRRAPQVLWRRLRRHRSRTHRMGSRNPRRAPRPAGYQLRRPMGAQAAAHRLPEPVLRNRQIRPGRAPRGRRSLRSYQDQAEVLDR